MTGKATAAAIAQQLAQALERARASYRAGQLPEAERMCRAIIAQRPAHFAALNLLGLVLGDTGRIEEAARRFHQVAVLTPSSPIGYINEGTMLASLERYAEAIACFDRAVALDPRNTTALDHLGITLHRMERYAEALTIFDRVLAITPDAAETLAHRAAVLYQLDRCEEAIVTCDAALRLRPATAETLTIRGAALRDLQRDEQALSSFARAQQLAPDVANAYVDEAMCRLAMGDWTQGWQKFEWRWQQPMLRRMRRGFSEALWLGDADLTGKTILLHAEQGLGDTLQFCRYAMCFGKETNVVLEVPRALTAVMATLPRAVDVVTAGDRLPAFDLHCPLMSLPLAFGTNLETIPKVVPYLRAPPDRTAAWRSRLGIRTAPRIGLAWWGRQHIAKRSIPLSMLAPLLRLPPFAFHALQQDIPASHQDTIDATRSLTIHATQLGDFADTAALILEMDLIITIDTSVAHLAGALGVPVWILLPRTADWRWLRNINDSPWYPTARLFRQRIPGDWSSVIADVASTLRQTIP